MDVTSAGEDGEQGIGGRMGRALRRDPGPDRQSQGTGGRIPEIDALRGMACLTIVIYHAMPHKVPGGWASIDLAFVLSGFLITSMLLNHREGKGSAGSFYLRRGLRVWPIYFLTVLLVAAAAPILRRPCDLAGLPYFLTYTQNTPHYWSGEVPNAYPYLAHTWAPAVEEQFFLLWVPLVFWLGRRGAIPLSLAIVAASVWARARGYHWWLLLARGDGLALGGLLAALLKQDRGPLARGTTRLRAALAAVGLAALGYLAALTAGGGMSTLGMPRWPAATLLAIGLLGFGGVGLVALHAGHPALRVLRAPGLVRVGQSGYELYMYHFVVLMLSDDGAHRLGLRGRPFWRDALTGIALVALVALSRRLVNGPIRALKDRLAPGPRPHPGPEGRPSFGKAPSAETAQEIG
jgi:peptidoglycan/LPS O-acetylase OafA/YrhL